MAVVGPDSTCFAAKSSSQIERSHAPPSLGHRLWSAGSFGERDGLLQCLSRPGQLVRALIKTGELAAQGVHHSRAWPQ